MMEAIATVNIGPEDKILKRDESIGEYARDVYRHGSGQVLPVPDIR